MSCYFRSFLPSKRSNFTLHYSSSIPPFHMALPDHKSDGCGSFLSFPFLFDTLNPNPKPSHLEKPVTTRVYSSRYCSFWSVSQLHSFKTRLLGRDFYTFIRNASGILQFISLGASVLVGTDSVSSSDTICNSLSLPLAAIVYFGLLYIAVSLMVVRERFSHFYKKCFRDLAIHLPWG